MGAKKKNKQNKKQRASRAAGVKKEKVQDANPFELKINRQKYAILGRKIAKTDKGKPGLSRSKAIKKRKETLLVEYKKLGRGNKVVDRRIGENDPTMSFDEKMTKRFALERQSILNQQRDLLAGGDNDSDGGEEGLTHFGRSLTELDKFDDPVLSDSDEDQDEGRISAKVVGEEHFGGFLTKKKPDDSEQPDKPKSWKEKMEEIIARSKKAKFERQAEREKTLAATKTVDAEWKELQMLMAALKKNREQESEAEATKKKKSEDYDVVVRQLHFETKAKPSDRLKTEEEIAKEEKERLEELEADRIRRMHGNLSEVTQKSTTSADDLDDGLLFGAISGENEDNEEDAKSDDDDENEESDEDESNDNDGDDDDDDESDGGDRMQDLSDVEPSDSDDEVRDEESSNTTNRKRVHFADQPTVMEQEQPSTVKLTKEEMEAAKKELPYTFPAPETYEDLLELLSQYTDDQILTVVERLRKCHHPSLAEGNKTKLETLFSLLLQYFGDVALRGSLSCRLLDGLTRHLFDLTQMSPIPCGRSMSDLIFDRHRQFASASDRRNGRGIFPGLDVLLYLKLASILFPASDRRHPVITPAMLFMSCIITKTPVSSTKDVATGLFICSLFADYVSLSKRFVPEVINFLLGVLFLAAYKVHGKVIPVVPPFKTYGKNRDLLKITADCREKTVEPVDISRVFVNTDEQYLQSTDFQIHSLSQCLQLLSTFAGYYVSLPSFTEIFSAVKHYANLLPLSKYPPRIVSLHTELLEKLNAKTVYTPLVRPATKPQPLKLLEPRITENFDVRKKQSGGSKEFNERQRLIHKHKRELKGAIREVRKDTQFLAQQKLDDQIARDNERKRKVKEIFGQLAQQEGECRALKKAKNVPNV